MWTILAAPSRNNLTYLLYLLKLLLEQVLQRRTSSLEDAVNRGVQASRRYNLYVQKSRGTITNLRGRLHTYFWSHTHDKSEISLPTAGKESLMGVNWRGEHDRGTAFTGQSIRRAQLLIFRLAISVTGLLKGLDLSEEIFAMLFGDVLCELSVWHALLFCLVDDDMELRGSRRSLSARWSSSLLTTSRFTAAAASLSRSTAAAAGRAVVVEIGDVTCWCLPVDCRPDELSVVLITSTHQTKIYDSHNAHRSHRHFVNFAADDDRALIFFAHQP